METVQKEVVMPVFSSLFENQEAKPIKIGHQRVTLISRALRWQFPGLPGGLVWSRPYAVRVETESAGETILPVVDDTRRQQWLLLGLGLLGSLLIGLLLARR
jgi:hypothetical protein